MDRLACVDLPALPLQLLRRLHPEWALAPGAPTAVVAEVVVWKQVFEQHAVLVKTAAFLAICGRLQSEQNVVHLIAEKLWLPRVTAPPATGGSRDIH